MRFSVLVSASILAVVLTAPAAPAQTLSSAGETAIRRHVQELMDTTNINPMATLEKYVRTAEVSSVNDETIVRGWNALVQQTQTQQATAGSFYIQTGEVDVVSMGPHHALAIAPFTMSYQTNGGPVQVPGSMTLAFAWTDDGWKIVHEHYSTGLDERSRQRLAQAASHGGGLQFGDLVNLFLTVLGGGGARDVAVGLAQALLEGSACNR